MLNPNDFKVNTQTESSDEGFVASRLKKIILAKKISIKELADELNMPYQTLLNYSNGSREPKWDFLMALHKAGISLNWFMGDSDEMYRLNEPNWEPWIDSSLLNLINVSARLHDRTLGQEITSRLKMAIATEINPDLLPELEAKAKVNGRMLDREISWRLDMSLEIEREMADQQAFEELTNGTGDAASLTSEQCHFYIDVIEDYREERARRLHLPYKPLNTVKNKQRDESHTASSIDNLVQIIVHKELAKAGLVPASGKRE